MYQIVLLRHGESVWNLEDRFTGWEDVDLTEKGVTEARQAGKILRDQKFTFDIAFTSLLKRAIKTLYHALDEMDLLWILDIKAWELNERHYGALQGLNKKDTADKYGSEKVLNWRRSFESMPPLLEPGDLRSPIHDKRYAAMDKTILPLGESLERMMLRVIPYWTNHILPVIGQGNKVIISSHGNTLRGLIKYLDKISDEEIVSLNIPTGIPLVYELDNNFSPMRHYYLSK